MGRFQPSLLASDPAERARFLVALRAAGTISGAAKATGICVATVGRLRRRDAGFAAACAAVIGDPSAHKLEASLLDRLTNGTERYRFFADSRVEMWLEFDNALALTVLRQLWPQKWGLAAATVPPVPPPPPPPPPPMTRAEFIAVIEARPHPDGLD
jgi:hypothetical protein